MDSDLVVDHLDVLRVTDQNMLVDQLRSELAALRRAAVHRQRTFVFLLDPTSFLRRPKISLHGIWTGSNYYQRIRLTLFRLNHIQRILYQTKSDRGLFSCWTLKVSKKLCPTGTADLFLSSAFRLTECRWRHVKMTLLHTKLYVQYVSYNTVSLTCRVQIYFSLKCWQRLFYYFVS